MDSINYVARLNEYAQKERLELRYEEVGCVGPDHIRTFTLKAVVNGKPYPEGVGKNKKEAKQSAAKYALTCLLDETSVSVRIIELIVAEVSSPQVQVKTNYMCWLNEYGQKSLHHPVTFTGYSSHDGVRYCRFVVGDKEFPAAFGKTKKEAREEAARLVHHEILGNETLDVSTEIHNCTFFPQMLMVHSFFFLTRIAAIFPNAKDNSKEVKNEGSDHDHFFSRFETDYKSIQQLDKGAFGRVFKAKHKLEGKYYAVKIVKTLEEVKVLSELNHCNIVRYHSCWLEDTAYSWDTSTDSSSYLYIQMELCEIKTLRIWIDEKNIQNPKKSLRDSRRRDESVDIMVQMVSGVKHIHSNMLIHRDLKPANIMFSRNGTVKIGDFGLVTSEIEDDAENQKERRGYKGTPPYMAPEQKERRLYDRKVDIFALGLIFFELLWNIPTIHEKEKVRLFLCLVSHVFVRLDQMIKSMLCGKPEERPEASKIKTDLEQHKHLLAELKTKQLHCRTVI
uniref:Eukaryotic translation initiation factor 2-alpha kinase 2 n=1 Tax=Xiphophorus couchianus TaxID=32473 RepID=A0A3B5LF26_9TELE